MNTTILVIEDSLPINELICINLETAGYEAVPFFDGDEAAVILTDFLAIFLRFHLITKIQPVPAHCLRISPHQRQISEILPAV